MQGFEPIDLYLGIGFLFLLYVGVYFTGYYAGKYTLAKQLMDEDKAALEAELLKAYKDQRVEKKE